MDLRMPVGVLFVMMGLLLGCYGLFTQAKAPVDPGFNVNAVWGAAMVLFGLLMGLGARLASRRRG